jgi:hypothetical protein
MTDIALLRRRHRPADGYRGCECWLLGVYPPGAATPILAITNRPHHLGGDIVYDGVTYTYYNCTVETPPDTDSEHALPEGVLRISNILRALVPSLYENDFYRGYTVQIIPYNDAESGVDYSGEVSELVWVNYEMDGNDLLVTLGVPQEYVDLVPEDSYSAYSCRHRFRVSAGVYGARCGYTVQAVTDVGLAGGNPVAVRVPGHGLATGDVIELSSMSGIGITPALDGTYTITLYWAEPTNVFLLDGTDGGDYAGVYGAGGAAGYYACAHHRVACNARGRLASFGGVTGQRSDALRVAV